MKKVITPVVFLLLVIVCISLLKGCPDFNVTWTPVEYSHYKGRPAIKVYVENSGSMDGYMCEGSELKDAVYSYVSTLGSYADTVELNYINSMIVPFGGNIKAFINNLNAAAFKKTGGNKTNSDIADMLDQILKSLRANDIAIFVSDCILDVPQGNAKDYLVNRQIDIRNAFVKKLQEDGNIGVEIFRLESKYSGMYYYYKGGERLTDVKRPYYMWVIGNKHALAHANRKVPFSQIKHGVVDYFAYSTYEEVPFEITNQFGLVLNPCKCKTSNNGQYTIKIQTDLSTMLQEEKMIADVTRFKTQNPRVRVVSVEKISSTKDPNTHVLTINIDKGISACGEYIKYVQPETPYWLDSANDETGDSIKKNINKTTGIKNIILGVSDAYSEHRELAGVKFVINN